MNFDKPIDKEKIIAETRDLSPKQDPRENAFRDPIPVEKIIPEIKKETKKEEEQIKVRERKDRSFGDDFWRYIINYLITENKIIKKYISKQRKSGLYIFKENTPNIYNIPNLLNPSNYENGFSEILTGLKLFENQIIIDLGAGASESGCLLSQLLKAKAYIAVEPFNNAQLEFWLPALTQVWKNRQEELKNNPDKEESSYGRMQNSFYSVPGLITHQIPYSVVKNDMLSFLQRLPDNSVSIIMGGIASEIIGDSEYLNAVAKEIERVLNPNGALYTNSTNTNSIMAVKSLKIIYDDNIDKIFKKL